MKCFNYDESDKLICNIFIVSFCSILTILAIVVFVFIYRIVRYRNRGEVENTDEINIDDHLDLGNMLYNALKEMKSLKYDSFKLLSRKSGYSQLSDKTIVNEGDGKTCKSFTEDDKKNDEKYSDGDDTLDKHRLSDIIITSDVERFQRRSINRYRKFSNGSSLDTQSYATVFIDDNSFDSAEQKRVYFDIQLPLSYIEGNKNLYKTSSSSEGITLYRSQSFRNSLTLYDTQNHIYRYNGIVNLATHVIPETGKYTSPNISTAKFPSNNLPRESLTRTATRVNLFSLPRRISTSNQNRVSYTTDANNEDNASPSYASLGNLAQQTPRNSNQHNYPMHHSPDDANVNLLLSNHCVGRLYCYVPQYVISNSVNAALQSKL